MPHTKKSKRQNFEIKTLFRKSKGKIPEIKKSLKKLNVTQKIKATKF